MEARDLVERAGVELDGSNDQHFLVDDRLLERIAGYPETEGDAHVLEVGGGVGNLTRHLVEGFDRVTVVEIDPELAGFLRREFEDEDVEVVEGDVLDVDLPDFDTCVSNLPYSASSPVLFRLLPLGRELVVTVQKEFGERLVAEPGDTDYGRLSVTARQYAEPELLETVPPTSFVPSPEVESAVVRLEPSEPDYTSGVPDDLFLDIVRGTFTQRRKTLRNALRNTTHITGIDAESVVESLPEDLVSKRPGKMKPSEFAAVAEVASEGPDDEG